MDCFYITSTELFFQYVAALNQHVTVPECNPKEKKGC